MVERFSPECAHGNYTVCKTCLQTRLRRELPFHEAVGPILIPCPFFNCHKLSSSDKFAEDFVALKLERKRTWTAWNAS